MLKVVTSKVFSPFDKIVAFPHLMHWERIQAKQQFYVLHPMLSHNTLWGDSTLRTLHSDTKIYILNPNLNVKMFNKGVQTNIENTFSVPFPPNKKML